MIWLTNGWDCCDDLAKFELVEDSGFTGSVQPHHQDPHLFLAEEAFEQGGEHVTHGETILSTHSFGSDVILDKTCKSCKYELLFSRVTSLCKKKNK